MSCDAVALAATLWLASTSAVPATAQPNLAVTPPSVASEPLFTDIVRRAGKLKSETQAFEKVKMLASSIPVGVRICWTYCVMMKRLLLTMASVKAICSAIRVAPSLLRRKARSIGMISMFA